MKPFVWAGLALQLFAFPALAQTASIVPPGGGEITPPVSVIPPGGGAITPPVSAMPAGGGTITPPTSVVPPGGGAITAKTPKAGASAQVNTGNK